MPSPNSIAQIVALDFAEGQLHRRDTVFRGRHGSAEVLGLAQLVGLMRYALLHVCASAMGPLTMFSWGFQEVREKNRL
jgi:hypothetical protein